MQNHLVLNKSEKTKEYSSRIIYTFFVHTSHTGLQTKCSKKWI